MAIEPSVGTSGDEGAEEEVDVELRRGHDEQERLDQHRDQEQALGSARVSVLPGEELLDLPDEG